MYHISDLKKYTKCKKLYFLDLDKESLFLPYLRSDESYIDLLIKKLNISNYFLGKVGDDAFKFFANKDMYEWFVNTRFEDGKLRVKVPVLHKINDDLYDVYFTVYGTQIRDLDTFTYRITLEVLKKNGIKIDNVYLSLVNKDYVFHNEINPQELFVIIDEYNDKKLIDIVNEKSIDYQDIIDNIESTSLSELPSTKSRVCHLRNICNHYYECFKDESDLSDDSILTLVSSNSKNSMYEEGVLKLKDIDLSRIDVNRVQYAQIMASKNGGLFVDKNGLSNWLEHINEKPISYIDFEWDRYLIPAYEGMKPLDVIPFEFALYVDDENDKLKHYTYISSGDCRREFAEKLIEYIPEEGKIFAYNAIGAEILRIKELAELFPDLKEKLLNICGRIVDLATPIVEGVVYDTRMAGDFSLKKLVNVVSGMSYNDLEIDDGMEAVYRWRDIDKGIEINTNSIVENLKKYCSLDAYGLFLVHKWLQTLIK